MQVGLGRRHRTGQLPWLLTGCPEWWGREISLGPTDRVSGVTQPSLSPGQGGLCLQKRVYAEAGSQAWFFDLFEAEELGSGLALKHQRVAPEQL